MRLPGDTHKSWTKLVVSNQHQLVQTVPPSLTILILVIFIEGILQFSDRMELVDKLRCWP
jgi:hypothetical protein